MPVPPPDHHRGHDNSGTVPSGGDGGGGGGGVGLGEGANASPRRGDDSTGPQTPPASTVAATAADGKDDDDDDDDDLPQRPIPMSRGSSLGSLNEQARPLAVLEVINKRGDGIFGEHEEAALVRLCARVDSLLRRKAVEVSLLWSGMTERSFIRKSAAVGAVPGAGAGGAAGGGANGGGSAVDRARIESNVVRQFSDFSPSNEDEGAAVGDTWERRRSAAFTGGGGGGGDVGVGGAGTDSELDARRVDLEHSASGDSTWPPDNGSGKARSGAHGGGAPRCIRPGSKAEAAAVSGKSAADRRGCLGGSGRGGNHRVGRALVAEAAHEEESESESELVNLGVNLFDQSSNRLLSLVGRFFRSLGLTELFQVCFVCG